VGPKADMDAVMKGKKSLHLSSIYENFSQLTCSYRDFADGSDG